MRLACVGSDCGFEPDLLRRVSYGARRVGEPRPEPTSTGRRKKAAGASCQYPWWLTMVHMLFMGWTVMNAHYRADASAVIVSTPPPSRGRSSARFRLRQGFGGPP